MVFWVGEFNLYGSIGKRLATKGLYQELWPIQNSVVRGWGPLELRTPWTSEISGFKGLWWPSWATLLERKKYICTGLFRPSWANLLERKKYIYTGLFIKNETSETTVRKKSLIVTWRPKLASFFSKSFRKPITNQIPGRN